MRRFSSGLTRSADRGSPGGIPWRTATRPRPCDSPAVVKRNVTLRHLPQNLHNLHQPPPTSPIIAREPDSGPGSSRSLQAVPPLHIVERGSGGEDSSVERGPGGEVFHRRGGACGLMFVMVGSETTTSPRAVIPNRYCWPVDTSSATRNGPMIGSRIEIF